MFARMTSNRGINKIWGIAGRGFNKIGRGFDAARRGWGGMNQMQKVMTGAAVGTVGAIGLSLGGALGGNVQRQTRRDLRLR